MDSCSLSAVLDALTPGLPSLVGTLIGGAVTLFATYMTARHQNKLEDKRLDASREDEWRRFERENLVGLQEAVQRGMRATGKCCLQMDKLATEGKEWADWIVDPADSEMQRQSLEDILLLSCRIDAYCAVFATPFHAPLLQRSMADCHVAMRVALIARGAQAPLLANTAGYALSRCACALTRRLQYG